MTSGKVVPKKLPREVYKALEDIVGPEWISEDRAIVEAYSKTQSAGCIVQKHNRDPTPIPACVVLPGSVEEVQAIVRVCNRYKLPFTPYTNAQHGAPTVPGTVVIHLKRLDKILEINEEDMYAIVQPFVSMARLEAEARRRGLFYPGNTGSTIITKFGSIFTSWGMNYTDAKYGTLARHVLGIKVVLPTGELMCTGSLALPKAGPVCAEGPGPNLWALFRGSWGTRGIIVELAIKLFPWFGDPWLPEDEHPNIHNYPTKGVDRPKEPIKNTRFYVIDYPNIECEVKGLYKLLHSGIGIAINAFTSYAAKAGAPTLEGEYKAYTELIKPKAPFNVMVMLAATTSQRQLSYEEKVLKAIVEETGGKIVSDQHKPELLDLFKPWLVDTVSSVLLFRWNRRGGRPREGPCGNVVPASIPAMMKAYEELQRKYPPISPLDTFGVSESPAVFALDRHSVCYETEYFTRNVDRREFIEVGGRMEHEAYAMQVKLGSIGLPHWSDTLEPINTFFPEIGPNAYLFFRKVRKVFDPNSVMAPGRQVWDEDEFKKLPESVKSYWMEVRSKYSLPPLEVDESGVKWRSIEKRAPMAPPQAPRGGYVEVT